MGAVKTGVCNYLYGRDVKATGKFCAGGVVDACQVIALSSSFRLSGILMLCYSCWCFSLCWSWRYFFCRRTLGVLSCATIREDMNWLGLSAAEKGENETKLAILKQISNLKKIPNAPKFNLTIKLQQGVRLIQVFIDFQIQVRSLSRALHWGLPLLRLDRGDD